MKTDIHTDQPSAPDEGTQNQTSRPLPPIPTFDSSIATNITHIPDSQPPSQTDAPDIPELLISQLESITSTLRSSFSTKPPHTIQRLAELVLSPTKYYRTLPAWLRAVDRAVSVSSTADIFPLPTAQPLPPSMVDAAMMNGIHNGENGGPGGSWPMFSSNDGLGSDESLGGALLTPIPWLRNGEAAALSSPRSENLDSEISHELIPEREDGAVTQGELIRREQEAGIVPVSHAGGRIEGSGELNDEADDTAPHATGPNVVGVEDMGLQDGQDVELQLNRKYPEVTQQESESRPDTPQNDGDIVLADADGKGEENVKAGTTGEDEDPDASDTTAL